MPVKPEDVELSQFVALPGEGVASKETGYAWITIKGRHYCVHALKGKDLKLYKFYGQSLKGGRNAAIVVRVSLDREKRSAHFFRARDRFKGDVTEIAGLTDTNNRYHAL